MNTDAYHAIVCPDGGVWRASNLGGVHAVKSSRSPVCSFRQRVFDEANRAGRTTLSVKIRDVILAPLNSTTRDTGDVPRNYLQY